MSLAINVDNVSEVLLADGWHTVHNASFSTDSYEFTWNGRLVHGGGNSGVCATGFDFQEIIRGTLISTSGPLTAVLAVRHDN